MNLEYCNLIITKLLNWGVQEFYICAGVRNLPIIDALNAITSEKQLVFNHFEERSASFYALGRIKALKKPVAVVVTSGTAVGELLPATMEAYYAGLPLVLITADRPENYRGTGAPQSAEQKNIFGNYVSKCFDLTPGMDLNLEQNPHNKPLHINICLSAPLRSGRLEAIELTKTITNNTTIDYSSGIYSQIAQLSDFISSHKSTLIIVAKLNPCPALIEFLKNQNLPVYYEALSNIRELTELNSTKIKCADKLWVNSLKCKQSIDSVIKIGGTPTHRIWRDLDETRKDIKVLSISENQFSGIPNALHIETNFELFFSNYNKQNTIKQKSDPSELLTYDQEEWQYLQELCKQYPQSEQAWHLNLSELIPINSRIYLGNSLPVRYWDLSATYHNKKFNIEASRGLNGIDGQISCFLGFAEEQTNNWGIFGDLTTLYDLSAPWMLQHRPKLNVNICIINNSGGQIFNRLVDGKLSELVINRHEINFEHWARLWNLEYLRVENIMQLESTSTNSRVIEVVPNAKQTNDFNAFWDRRL